MQAQSDLYWRQGPQRDRWAARPREDWSDRSRTDIRRDPRADYPRYDPRYERSDRDWDALGEFDERGAVYQGPGVWRDLEEGSGYTYRDDYDGRYYGPRGGRDYYSERDSRWRSREGGMTASDYRDDYPREDWRGRDDYYYSERDRYRDEWAGHGGGRGGWDDRWRAAPGDRMGGGWNYPDYEGAAPGERYWRDRGEWRNDQQWPEVGPRGGRWHGDQWSGRFDDGRLDPGRANMGPGSVAGQGWGPEAYRQGRRSSDWRAEQWRGSPGDMGSFDRER
jgi:hypothetical protein